MSEEDRSKKITIPVSKSKRGMFKAFAAILGETAYWVGDKAVNAVLWFFKDDMDTDATRDLLSKLENMENAPQVFLQAAANEYSHRHPSLKPDFDRLLQKIGVLEKKREEKKS